MRSVSPIEMEFLPMGAKLWVCEKKASEVIRTKVYLHKVTHKTCIELRYRNQQGQLTFLPWSLDTNKLIGEPQSSLWLEHCD